MLRILAVIGVVTAAVASALVWRHAAEAPGVPPLVLPPPASLPAGSVVLSPLRRLRPTRAQAPKIASRSGLRIGRVGVPHLSLVATPPATGSGTPVPRLRPTTPRRTLPPRRARLPKTPSRPIPKPVSRPPAKPPGTAPTPTPTPSPTPSFPAPAPGPPTVPVAAPAPVPPTRDPAGVPVTPPTPPTPPVVTPPTPPVVTPPTPPPVTPPTTSLPTRPGNGWGDKNHDHTGPPGQKGDHGHKGDG